MKQKIESQNALQKGVLFTWNDERGFGFILPENAAENIFIHISAFGKISRRPKVGDIIYYHLKKITSSQKGKYTAYNATIEGVKKEPKRLSRKPAKKRISFGKLIVGFMVFLIIFVYGISKIISSPPPQIEIPQIETPELSSHSQQYHCAGKVYCSEMDSCEEARYYLHNCPSVKIDGDGDGMPCEEQCGH
ncbi:MAG: excalibur calcium-binding domain-containing protein [Candidatus Parabeggiatoa sp.]|nr:excalibur calcium-binding domain-containing protein [Candidatus Parabeggiatoa sp.]